MKETRNIKELSNWSKNPRGIKKESFERLKKQIQKLGMYKPLLITEDGTVLGGNMRLRAYKELGITDVWVSVVEAETDDKKLEYALSDNDRAGYYEEGDLAELVSNSSIDTDLFHVDMGSPISVRELLQQLSPEEVVEDEAPEVQEVAFSKLGEVYQLGRHRLMCGDATSIENVEMLMAGQKADMVFTDPPYNISYEGGSKKRKMIENDHVDDFYKFLYDMYVNLLVVTKEGASVYVTHADTERVNFTKAFLDAGFYLSGVIIWVKNNSTFGRQDYKWKHEPMLYGWNSKGSHKWLGAMNEDTTWLIDRPSRSDEHPTMKPIELIARATNNSSKSEDIVLDVFGGSGSTLIACEQLNRVCYMMELDPHYCDVIRKRYANLIGQGEKWEEITPIIATGDEN